MIIIIYIEINTKIKINPSLPPLFMKDSPRKPQILGFQPQLLLFHMPLLHLVSKFKTQLYLLPKKENSWEILGIRFLGEKGDFLG